MGKVKAMRGKKCSESDWAELLDCIKLQNVIPVIGQGLYRVDIEAENVRNCLLYDYLTEQILKKCEVPIPQGKNIKFPDACLEFLKRNDENYRLLSDFLEEKLSRARLIPAKSLWKLTRIKSFNIFINAAYDSLLEQTLNSVRNIPTKTHSYTKSQKYLGRLNLNSIHALENFSYSLVFHIFGHFKNLIPAYTEKDIQDNINGFQQDIVTDPHNTLSPKLASSCLFYLGFSYDDWWLRSFLSTLSAGASHSSTSIFIGGFSAIPPKSSIEELGRLLESYKAKVFYSCTSEAFIDCLFDKIVQKFPESVIKAPDFASDATYSLNDVRFPACLNENESTETETSLPGEEKKNGKEEPFAMISFIGANRDAARRLASNLKSDGIDVWLDEFDMRSGDKIYETIMQAIDNCPVFIPIISRESKKLAKASEVKFHIKEWERALSNMESGKNPQKIIPVKIDDTSWLYVRFKNLLFVNIPGGKKKGKYKKLIKDLGEIQKQIQLKKSRDD